MNTYALTYVVRHLTKDKIAWHHAFVEALSPKSARKQAAEREAADMFVVLYWASVISLEVHEMKALLLLKRERDS